MCLAAASSREANASVGPPGRAKVAKFCRDAALGELMKRPQIAYVADWSPTGERSGEACVVEDNT
jgi:hypothetical protein